MSYLNSDPLEKRIREVNAQKLLKHFHYLDLYPDLTRQKEGDRSHSQNFSSNNFP